MRDATELFVIDATGLLEASQDAFSGAPLLVANGEDHTFLFGVIRDLLRIRQGLGIQQGIVVVGQEAHQVTSADNVAKTVSFLKELAVPVAYNPNTPALDLCVALAPVATCVVTGNRSLLMLAKDGRRVILLKDSKAPEVFISETVASRFGVRPDCMPAFLALTDGPQPTVLTKGQAIALLERHGDLEVTLRSLSTVSSRQIRNRLATNNTVILQRLQKFSPSGCPPSMEETRQNSFEFNLDNDRNARLLEKHAFHSLVRLLPRPTAAAPIQAEATSRNPENYRAIATPEDLEGLVTRLRASDCCAVDTESSDRDPHAAELFGVSISIKKGEAFYLPLVQPDLKGMDRDVVLSAIKKVLEGPIKVIGHNLKYDYVLLRKNGIRIANFHFDTLLAAYDCFGDWEFLNLPFVAGKLLGKKITSYQEVVGKRQSILEVPFRDLLTHACADADTTLQLYGALQKELDRREVADQYRNETLALASRLGEWECDGIPVRRARLSAARRTLIKEIAALKKLTVDEVGVSFNVDSEKELLTVLARNPSVADFIGRRRLSLALVEGLAVSHPLAWKVVRYRRKQGQLRHVEEVLKAVRGKRLYPVFNQTRFDHGGLSSLNPRLFNEGTHPLVLSSIDHQVAEHFPSARNSLDIIERAAQDDVLRKDRRNANPSNLFLKTGVELRGADHERLLLAFLIGMSGDRIRRAFSISHEAAAALRHDLEVRYLKSFQWLAHYRRRTAECGFAVENGRRRWFEGLRSSNLAKREKALSASVRWLLKW